jgi:hypothetical protein
LSGLFILKKKIILSIAGIATELWLGRGLFIVCLYRLSAEQVADFYRIFVGFFHDSVELKDILSKFSIFIMHYLSVYSNVFKKCALKVALAIHFAFEMSIES